MSPRSTRLATAESAATPRIRATSGREHGPRYATIASVSSAACDSPRSTGPLEQPRARVGGVTARPEREASGDLPRARCRSGPRVALPQQPDGRLDPLRMILRRVGELVERQRRALATTRSASTVLRERSTGLRAIRRSGLSIRESFRRRLLGNPYGGEGCAWLRAISPDLRSSSSASSATACSTRERPSTSLSKSKTRRRVSTRGSARGTARRAGSASAMCPSETVGGGTASARSAAPSASGSCGASRRSARGASGAGPIRKNRSCSDAEALEEPGGSLLHAPVLGEASRELLRGLLGLELAELGGLVGEERARLELEERRDEDEELAARLEIELVALRHALDEREDDGGDVDLAGLELLLQEQREEEIERPLEGVELQLELPDGRRQHARRLAARAGRVSAASRPGRAPRRA